MLGRDKAEEPSQTRVRSVNIALGQAVDEAQVSHWLNNNAMLSEEVWVLLRFRRFCISPKTTEFALALSRFNFRCKHHDFFCVLELLDIKDHATIFDVGWTRKVVVARQQGFKALPRIVVAILVFNHSISLFVIVDHARRNSELIERSPVKVVFVVLAQVERRLQVERLSLLVLSKHANALGVVHNVEPVKVGIVLEKVDPL